MPRVDMPVEELFKYNGISPCPADIDEYWDKALSEMRAIDPKAELVEKDYVSKCATMYDLFFTGTKNSRIHAKMAVPKNAEGKMPAVLMFHGLGDASWEWCDLLKHASQGYVTVFMDARGQGGSSEELGVYKGTTCSNPFIRGIEGEKEDLLMRDLYLDTAMLARVVMDFDFVDETRVAATGGSQGGCLGVVCACLVPEIKKCAVYYPYLSDFKRVMQLDLCQEAYDGICYYFRYFDPRHEREDEFFERLGYIDIQNLAKRMKAEFVMFSALSDTIVPPSTQFAMYNKVTSKKKVYIYPEYGHEGLRGAEDIIFNFFSDL